MEEFSEDRKSRIKSLAEKYGINLKSHDSKDYGAIKMLDEGISIEDIHLRRLYLYPLAYCMNGDDKHLPNGGRFYSNSEIYNLRLAELIELFHDAIEASAPIEFTATIKGITRNKIKLSGNDLDTLYFFLNTELESVQDGLYQSIFNWEFREVFEWRGDSCFTKPYTMDELSKILAYERRQMKKIDRSKTQEKKRYIRMICTYLREEGVFNNITKELNSNEYQFLYDFLAMLGFFNEETICDFSKSMKKDALRDYIRNR